MQEVLSFTLALAKCRAMCPAHEASHPEASAPTDEHDASPLDHGSSGSEDGSDLDIQQGTYFLTVQKRPGFRRLHRMGECATKPQRCFNARVLGEVRPLAAEFDAMCRHCFRVRLSEATTVSSGSSSDS